MKTLLIPFALSLTITAAAQTAGEIIKKMNGRYATCHSYQMKIDTRLLLGSHTVQQYTGTVAKSGEQYVSDFMGRTVLLNDQYFLMVDEERRNMVFNQRQKEQRQPPQEMLAQLDDLLKHAGDQVAYLQKESDNYQVRITLDDRHYTHADLSIRKSDYALLQFSYGLQKKTGQLYDRVVITYTDVRLDQPIPSSVFSAEAFVAIVAGKAIPTDKYQHYQFTDQTDYESILH